MASSWSGVPAHMTVKASVPTSRILASKMAASSVTWPRLATSARTVASISSRSTHWPSLSSLMSTTLMSLSSWRVTCSRGADSASTTIVMREKRSSSVGLTAREKMLNPRRENRPVTRVRTAGLFSTRTDRMWWVTDISGPLPLRRGRG